ncbi:transglycosylase domain-containing protein [Microlunatus ginsengisoli]|uniref:Penicillin-insensitive transglycosylase n=1 Tax=Microlunatus ginsengisoli TaxID=363863 RepID=A0ABP7AD89_9ACTN
MADPDWGPVEPLPGKRAGKNGSTTPTKAKEPKTKGRLWAGRIAKVVAAAALLGLVAVTAIVFIGYNTVQRPNPNADFETATTFVYYNDGKSQLGSFAIQNRQPLTFEEMPDSIKQAIVAAENRTFWDDPGISIRGMVRSAWVIARGGDLQGGSTITQQYIKILYLNSQQTLTRKFKELFLAYKINKELSKEQILEGYLNTIYFGRGAYGIQAASKAYFNVDAKKLTVPQAAVLAAVVNNPSMFDPGVSDDNVPRLTERYHYVLTSMAQMGYITFEQAAQYAPLPKFPEVPTNERYGGPKGFLLKMVERELSQAGFDAGQISGGGLSITTTFDKKAQAAAVKSAQTYTKRSADAAGQKASKLHAAIASVQVGTGEVLALYGGPDYVKNSRNWATTARPTASTFKTYALAAGLKDGFSLRSIFNGNTFTPKGDSTSVRNEFSYQYGPVSLLKATADSINTAFVDLTTQMDDGPAKVMKAAQAAGAPKGAGWDDNSRVALGTAEVSPLDQANAYATFANDGTYVPAHVVKEVKDASGKVIYSADPQEKRAVSEDVARDVTYALEDVVEQGTGSTVRTLDLPIAGKTGTKDVADDIVSAWFVAYTKQISTAVMYVAGDGGNADLDDFRRPGDSTFFGGTYPALTWAAYMKVATDGLPVKKFAEPAWVNKDSAPNQPTYAPTTAQPTQTETAKPSQTPTAPPTTTAPTQSATTESPTKEPTKKPTGGASSGGNPNGNGNGNGNGKGNGGNGNGQQGADEAGGG